MQPRRHSSNVEHLAVPHLLPGAALYRSVQPTRATAEVDPYCSEAPLLRAVIPHLKTDLDANQSATRGMVVFPRQVKNIILHKKADSPTILGYGAPLLRKQEILRNFLSQL